MNDSDAEDVGFIVGFVTWVLVFTLVVIFSLSQWQHIVAAAKHPKGWLVHSGQIVHQTALVTTDPDIDPYRPSQIRYTDYFGRPEQVQAKMPYGSWTGQKVSLWVNPKGKEFVKNELGRDKFDNPTNASSDDTFYPGLAIVLGLFGALVPAILVELLTAWVMVEFYPIKLSHILPWRRELP